MALRLFVFPALLAAAVLPSSAQIEIFEKNARPLFAEKCQGCHNAKLKSGGIDLSTDEGIHDASATGVFGAPILNALGYEGRVKMPPAGKLPDEKIAAIRDWVKAGAPVPEVKAAAAVDANDKGTRPVALRGKITEADKKFWAFAPIAHAAPPVSTWSDNPIDRFVEANLKKNGLAPAAPADKATLLRRATFDLTGLPPTEKELSDFLADKSPKAFEKVVDRLLASPRYGERWGRQWLDVVRYADSTGSDEDHRYPHAWRYRDYVIQAFNDDMPYDQFVREQLAGDVMGTTRGIVATGFLALGKKALAQKDLPLKRYDVVDDQIDATSKAFLGLTVACARCHDHKFDPIATKDYYSMAAIFASTLSYEKGQDGPSVETPLVPVEQYEAFRKAWTAVLNNERATAKILDIDKESKKERDEAEKKIADWMLAARNGTSDDPVVAKWAAYLNAPGHPELKKWREATDVTRPAVAKAYAEEFRRSAYQYDQDLSWWKQAHNAFPTAGKVAGPRPEVDRAKDAFFYAVAWAADGPLYRSDEDRIAALAADKQQQIRPLLEEHVKLEAAAPKQEIPMACAVKEGPTMEQKVFLRGDYHNTGDPVDRIAPAILRLNAPEPEIKTNSGRLELANWIVDPRNPTPSRVMANRIWQGHFVDGLVRTPDNFGKLGDRPSNPELLDYLASSFMEGGWSVKKMHRQIMLSKTYQQSAQFDEAKKAKDPENRLLSHFPKRRLTIEELRDSYLALGGDLDLTMGGTLDPGVGTDGETSSTRISMNPESTNRRSVYLPLRRSNLPTLYMLFDFGDATTPDGKRGSTTVATQALFAMNSPMVNREAKALADKTLARDRKDSKRLEDLYVAILDRRPDAKEADEGLTYLAGVERRWKEIDEHRAWQSLCHALMASNEFMYVY